MRILLYLTIVALGKTNEIIPTTRKLCETLDGNQPLGVSSYSIASDSNTHVSSSQGPFKSYGPAISNGLTSTESSVTGTGFISSSGSFSSGQQHVQPLSAGAEIGSQSGFSTNGLPKTIAYHVVSSTSSPLSYVNPDTYSGSYSLNSIPVQRQDSSFKPGSKAVEIISLEEDNKPISQISAVNSQNSSFVTNNSPIFPHSPTVSTQKSISTYFAGEKSDADLASRFIPIADENVNYLSKPKLKLNQNTIFSTNSETTAAKPLVNILSFSSFPILPTPTTSPTPYSVTVTDPVSTTVFPKTNFKSVTPSSYTSTIFKPYSTPLSSAYNSIYSTPNPLNTYSRVFSTTVPVTAPAPTTAFPKVNFKTVTLSPFTSTTFKPYSIPLYNKYNSIYTTPGPFNTYSRAFSTSVPVGSNAIKSSSVSNGVSQTVNNFFKPPHYVPSIISNVPQTYTSSIVTTQSPPSVTSFKPVSSKFISSILSKPYSTDKQSSSYSPIYSSPVTVNSTSPSFPVFKPSIPTTFPTPNSVSVTTPVPTTAFSTSNFKTVTPSTYSSTTFKPYSKPLSGAYNLIYSTPKPLNAYSRVFSTTVPVTNSIPTTAFSTSNFKTVTPSTYSSTTFKPYSSTSSLPYSYNSIYSTPKTFNFYSNVSSSSVPIVSNVKSSRPIYSKYISNVFSKQTNSETPKPLFETVTSAPYTSTTFKPYSATASPHSYNSIYSTPKTFNSYSSVLSTPTPIASDAIKFPSQSNGASQIANNFFKPTHDSYSELVTPVGSGKSSVGTAYKKLNHFADLTSRFDPIYTSVFHDSISTTPRPFEIYSTNYPKSNTIHGSSLSINEPVISQTSYSGKPSVLLPFRNLNSGVYNAPVTGQDKYYFGSLSPTFKVSENTLYSPLVPFSPASFSSLSTKSELYPGPPRLSYPSVYSSTIGKNVGLSSAAALGYTVQQAPLTKEYHTVEEPAVKTWKSIDTWNVLPASHLGTHWH